MIPCLQVSVDELRALFKSENVKAMPMLHLYRPNHGFLLAQQPVPSQLKSIARNLDVVVANPTNFFKLDPNHFVQVLDSDPNPERQQAKAAAAKLKASTGGLYERLMAASAPAYVLSSRNVLYYCTVLYSEDHSRPA